MDLKLKTVVFINYISDSLLFVALCLGLYTRWLHSDDIAVLLIAFLGLFVFTLAVALVYYFSFEVVRFSLVRLWIGCLLGIIMFTEPAVYDDGLATSIQEITNCLLLSSVCMHCIWCLMERVFHRSISEFHLISYSDLLEMVGFVIASLITGQDLIAVICFIIGLFLTITTIQLKSFLGVVNIVFIIAFANAQFFKLLNVTVNSYAFFCFLGRVSFEPIIDWYFVGLTMLQRWNGFLVARPVVRKLFIVCIIFVELGFLTVHFFLICHHKEWYVIVPMFLCVVVFWTCAHCAFFVMCWILSNKLTECVDILHDLPDSARSLQRIMASRGLRCFGLIAQRIACITLFTTNVVAIVAWETKSALSIGVWFIVLPLEICFFSLLSNLGTVLGGMCIGYAIVVPTLSVRLDMKTPVLPPVFMNDIHMRSTQILNVVQKFFAFHLIQPFGLEYSSGGLSLDALELKLRQFFQSLTTDGLRFDTYLVYYSGPVDANGDWALIGDDRLKLNQLLEWWKVTNPDSRLLLIFDTEQSYNWIQQIASNSHLFIAIQAWQHSKISLDSELGHCTQIGAFTIDWVDYNCGDTAKANWRSSDLCIQALYAVSESWTDFQFRSPMVSDVANYWKFNFQHAAKLMMSFTSELKFRGLCVCSDCILRCLRRKRMKWLPPLEYDTGHGFRLVHS